MKPTCLVLPLALLLAGCATTSPGTSPAHAGLEAKADTKADERRDKEHDLELARARLAVAELEAKAQVAQQEARLQQAKAELELMRAKLALFRDADRPNRLASERLDLQAAKDRAQEAADELAQIEIMYEDQDLDDLTAEFVVSRGRRAAERAQAQIQIREAQLLALEGGELQQQEQRLVLEVEKAESDLAKLELDGQIGRQKQAIAIQEARNAVEKLERELRQEHPEKGS
jgi:hypothetical protein